MPRSAIDVLIDRVDMLCTRCGAKSGTCSCWTECRCGMMFPTGGECRNPLHGVEAAAKDMAVLVCADILRQARESYPEAMKAASGGFRRTLKVVMEREFAGALTHWMMAKPEHQK